MIGNIASIRNEKDPFEPLSAQSSSDSYSDPLANENEFNSSLGAEQNRETTQKLRSSQKQSEGETFKLSSDNSGNSVIEQEQEESPVRMNAF